MFPDGGRINVVAFGWLFSGADLAYIDQWVRPSPLWGGFYRLAALDAERRRLRDLGYIHRLRVQVGRSAGFVAQLFGTNPGDFRSRRRHEEVIITQMKVVLKSGTDVQVRFFGIAIRISIGWPVGGCIMASIRCWCSHRVAFSERVVSLPMSWGGSDHLSDDGVDWS